jgi:hypothetical protein
MAMIGNGAQSEFNAARFRPLRQPAMRLYDIDPAATKMCGQSGKAVCTTCTTSEDARVRIITTCTADKTKRHSSDRQRQLNWCTQRHRRRLAKPNCTRHPVSLRYFVEYPPQTRMKAN